MTTTQLSRELQALLCGRFGAPLRHLEEIDSTNSEALRWATAADDPAPEGAVVVADRQTAGRGRWGRSWESGPGSLLVSVVLRPSLRSERLDLLTTTVGVAAVESLRETTGVDARLKWPNDVVAQGRKLAGILVESQTSADGTLVGVAGVGVNLDLRGVTLSDEVAQRAVSVAELTGDVPERAVVLAALLSWFEPLYRSLYPPGDPSEIVRVATERSVVVGREIELGFADGRTASGVARRILPDGSLEVDFADRTEVVRAGEVTAILAGPGTSVP